MKISLLPQKDNRLKPVEVLFISGCVLLSTWLISIILGLYLNYPLLHDLFHNPIGADFVQSYGAGTILLQGKSAQLYEQSLHTALQTSVFGRAPEGIFAFNYPPLYALFSTPFALLPYSTSFAVWTCLQLIALALTFRLFGFQPLKNSVRAIGWYPVFAALSFGQNSLFCLFILASVASLFRSKRLTSAGLCLSLLTIKPQLICGILLIGFFRIVDLRSFLTSFLLGTLLLHGITYLFLPEASQQFISHLTHSILHIDSQIGFPIQYSYALKSTLSFALVNTHIASALWIMIFTSIAIFTYWVLKNRTIYDPLFFTAGIFLTVWVTPYIMVYDLSLFIVCVLLTKSKDSTLTRIDTLFWVAPILGLLLVPHYVSSPLSPLIHVGSIGILLATILKIFQNQSPRTTSVDIRASEPS